MRLLLLLVSLLAAWPGVSQTLVPYRQGPRWGYADTTGHVVIRPQYDYTELMRHSLGRVWRGRQCGYLDATGREVLPPCYAAVAAADDAASHALLGKVNPRLQEMYLPPHTIVTLELVPKILLSRKQRDYQDDQLPQDDYRLGLYRSDGHLLLPEGYNYFHALGPDYFAASSIAGYHSGQRMGESVEYFQNEPYYHEQLLHRSGRWLLGGQWLPPIASLRNGWLETRQNLIDPYGIAPHVLRDTITGRQLIPRADEWGGSYSNIGPIGFGSPLLVAIGYREPPFFGSNSVYLLQPDGCRLTDRVFTEIQALDQYRAIAYTEVPGSVDSTAECISLAYGPPSSYRCILPRPLAGLLDLRTGRWLLSPRYWSMKPANNGFLVKLAGREGVADAQGKLLFLLPAGYGSLAPCRDSASGQPLPCWTAYTATSSMVLNSRGQPLLTLPDSLSWQREAGVFSHGRAAVGAYNSVATAFIELQPRGRRSRTTLHQVPHQLPPAPDQATDPVYAYWPGPAGSRLEVRRYDALHRSDAYDPYHSPFLYGLRTEAGREILPPEYHDIQRDPGTGDIMMRRSEYYGLLDSTGSWVLAARRIGPAPASSNSPVYWTLRTAPGPVGHWVLLRRADGHELLSLPPMPSGQMLVPSAFNREGLSLIERRGSAGAPYLGYVNQQGHTFFTD